MIRLVTALSQQTGVDVPDLLRAFAEYLFGRFNEEFPAFFEHANGALEFLGKVDEYLA